MPRPNYSRLILQTMTVYQLFITIIYNGIESQLKTKNELTVEQHVTYTTTLEKKLLIDIKHKNIKKYKKKSNKIR